MSSITVDFITLLWGTLLLIALVPVTAQRRSPLGAIMALAVVTYLWAQSGWTTSYLSGYEWGRDVSNWLWFIFNSLVMLVFTMWVSRGK